MDIAIHAKKEIKEEKGRIMEDVKLMEIKGKILTDFVEDVEIS